MPHDIRGQLVEVGQVVNLPCRVTNIYETAEYCSLESVHPMYPGDSKTFVTVNTKQVEVVQAQFESDTEEVG